MTVQEAQDELAAIVAELGRIEDRLAVVVAELLPSPEEDEMLEHRRAYDQVTEIRAVVECVLADDVQRARASLAAAAVVTEEQLFERWREKWG